MADESVLIGPPAPRESYLDMDRIIQAAKQTDAEAIHPGYGFLSENERFASAVADSGLIFIGPLTQCHSSDGKQNRSADNHAIIGCADCSRLSRWHGLCQRGREDRLSDFGEGGGGRWRQGDADRAVSSELSEAIAAAQREASHAFGDDRVFLEKYIDSPRHIEFQILADSHGNTVHLFERECSIQRRHQKIIEETPRRCLRLRCGR